MMPETLSLATNDTVREELRDGGFVLYSASFYDRERADEIVAYLSSRILWENLKFMGKPCRRATSWFADKGIEYRYSRQFHIGKGWDEFIDQIRREVQLATGTIFNSVLMHRYPDGKAAIGWHSDNEPELGRNPIIASLSLGATREFLLRHNETRETRTYPLVHGSLLLMGGTFQHHWQHSIAATSKPVAERFNLTFRYTRPRISND